MDGTEKQFLNIREFSRISGLSISTLRRRAKDGSVASIQPGGPGKLLLFPRNALDKQSSPPTSAEKQADTPKKAPPGRRPAWTVINQDT